MRSGRLFALSDFRNNKGLEKASEEITMERAKSFLNGKASQSDQELEKKENEEITYEEPMSSYGLYNKVSTKWLIN